jgi:hypothetical protein
MTKAKNSKVKTDVTASDAKSTQLVKAESIQKAIVTAFETRVSLAENDNQAKNLKAEIKNYTLPVIEYALALNVDLESLAKHIAIADKKHNDFIAVYALQKIRKILHACTQSLKSSLDGYTRTILENLLHNEQNNKSAYVSLSRSIEFSELDNQKHITKRYSCSASTAGTQASSTRQAMLKLNIATVTKGKVNDEFALTDSTISKKLQSLFVVADKS